MCARRASASAELLNEEKVPGEPVEDQGGAVSVLDAGGVDLGLEDEAQGIDQDVALAALDLLAGFESRSF